MQGAKFKLYHDAVLRSVRVKWLLHELVGDDLEVEYVDTYRGEQYSARFLAINPNHAVPVLKITMENGQSITWWKARRWSRCLPMLFPTKSLLLRRLGFASRGLTIFRFFIPEHPST